MAEIPKEYTVTVTAKEQLYESVWRLQVTSETPVPFTAGQYASFLIGNQRRPFSFASLPEEKTMEFVIGWAPNGIAQDFIEPLLIGETFRLLAPYGRFVLDMAETRPLILVAGGTGIAPIYGLLKQLARQGFPQPVRLFFASYDEERLYYHDELRRLSEQYAHFTYMPCLSKPSSAWSGQQGLVTTIIPDTFNDMPSYTYYVCGSPSFVTATVNVIKTQGVPPAQIHFERFT